jgi:hypothetical protein
VLAREYCDDIKRKNKPIILSHRILNTYFDLVLFFTFKYFLEHVFVMVMCLVFAQCFVCTLQSMYFLLNLKCRYAPWF